MFYPINGLQTKLLSDLYLAKFLDTATKPIFPCLYMTLTDAKDSMINFRLKSLLCKRRICSGYARVCPWAECRKAESG